MSASRPPALEAVRRLGLESAPGEADCPLCRFWMKWTGRDWKCSAGCDAEAIDRRLVELQLVDATTAELTGPLLRRDWLTGAPMDPAAVVPEPLPAIPGFPFMYRGACALVTGPTGGGRSSLVQACAYDAAREGIRTAYLSGEVTEDEFNARAADLATRRSQPIDDELRGALAHARWLDLSTVVAEAWLSPEEWVDQAVARFDVLLIDPLSSVASALDLDFDKSNAEFAKFYDRLVQPLVAADLAVVLLDNIGHAEDAKGRAKGASAKQDRADLTFSCKLKASPTGLLMTAGKVRGVRAPHRRGACWIFDREAQRMVAEADDGGAFRPTHLMEALSKAIEATPALSWSALRQTVPGKTDAKHLALELLVSEQYIDAKQDGNAKRHYSLRPYRQTDAVPSPQTAPDARGRTAAQSVPPSPVSIDGGRGTDEPDADAELERLHAKGLA